MKLAARFPVTSYTPVIMGFIFFHLLLVAISFYQFEFSWLQGILLPTIFISLYFTFKQYQRITQSADDLCWNGESWLMHQGENLNSVVYLSVLPTSWLTSRLSLINFTADDKEYSWLFSRAELGTRMYSQLVYLVRQDLKLNLKTQSNIEHK